MIKVFHSPRSRSNRVVWLCEEMGVPYDIVALKLGEKPPELLKHNPGATVPLMTDGELVLFESITMLEYIADRYGPTDLVLPPHHPNYWDYRQMLLFGEATLAAPINAMIGTLFRGPDDQKSNYTMDVIRDSFRKRLGVVSNRLAERPYVAGDSFTLADISVVYGLSIVKMVPPLGLSDLMAGLMIDYFQRCTEREAYQRMTKVK